MRMKEGVEDYLFSFLFGGDMGRFEWFFEYTCVI